MLQRAQRIVAPANEQLAGPEFQFAGGLQIVDLDTVGLFRDQERIGQKARRGGFQQAFMVWRDLQQAFIGLQRKGNRFLDELGVFIGRPYPAPAAASVARLI